MKYASFVLLVSPIVALADWNFDQGVDLLTDEVIYVAKSDYLLGIHTRSAVVQCVGGKFDVYFAFDEFLDDDSVSIRYRVDRDELEQDRWSPSAAGTAVFASKPEYIAHELVRGSKFIIEATDFRGVQHRSTFLLQGSSESISPVMTACNVDSIPPITDPSLIVDSPSYAGMWAVQLGSFSNQQNADKLAADLRMQGFAAFLSPLSTSSGQLYRVRIGPQKDRASAAAMAERLNRKGHRGKVVHHP